MLALIAGQGALPRILAQRLGGDLVVCELESSPSGIPGAIPFRLEAVASLVKTLKRRGVTELCFAGAIRRPPFDPRKLDLGTAALVPRILKALGAGDDAALRIVLGYFEENGFAIRGAHEVAPDLLPPAGIPTRAGPGERDRKDAARAAEIHRALGAVDVGQACAVAAGQALAVEALGGTDWMLASLKGGLRPTGPMGGIFYKAPKDGQDRRIDLPVIGPETVAGVAAAGLSGLVIEAGGVLVLDLPAVIRAADAAGLFLWVREP